jgi:hypothetical protein
MLMQKRLGPVRVPRRDLPQLHLEENLLHGLPRERSAQTQTLHPDH